MYLKSLELSGFRSFAKKSNALFFLVILFFALSVSKASAVTTISTDINTGGTLQVSGVSTLLSQVSAPYFTATTTATSTMPRLSSTGSSFDWICLTGDTCRSSWSSGSLFGKAWEIVSGYLAPTTTIGIMVNASSTIGDGTQAGGFTISGGATTTATSTLNGLRLPLANLWGLFPTTTPRVATSTLIIDYQGNVRAERYNVRPEDFGAVGDGVTDDSAAFAAAIASLPSIGGEVLLSNKIYKANVIINKSEVFLRGQGKSAADLLFYATPHSGTTIIPANIANPVILVRGSSGSMSGVQITDLAVRGVSITDGSVGIEFSRSDGTSISADSALLDRVSIVGLQTCLVSRRTDGLTFTNGTIYECGQIATFSAGGLYNSIQSSILFDSPLGGVVATGEVGFSYIGNTGVGRTGNYDVRLSNCSGCIIASNIFDLNADDTGLPTQVQRKHSIVVASSTMFSITGNSFGTNVNAGIGGIGDFSSAIIKLEETPTLGSITGNTFDTSSSTIWATSLSHTTISGNSFSPNSTKQINIDSGNNIAMVGNRSDPAKIVNNSTEYAMPMSSIDTLTAMQNSGGASVSPIVVKNVGAGANTAATIQFSLGGNNYGSIKSTAAPTGGGGAHSLGFVASGATPQMSVFSDTRVGIGTTSPVGKLHVSGGQNATTTITIGEIGNQGQANSKACFNTKNNTSGDISFYFVGTTMVVESNLCR